MISIALIEDNRLVREGIAALLNQLPDLEVVSGAATGDTSQLRNANPQVVLLDIGLRNGDSLRVAEKVRKEFPQSKVIVMDLLPVREDIVAFVNAGVSGFIMKDATLEDLVNTIRSVAGGAHVLPPQMTGTLFSQIARDAVARGRPGTLECGAHDSARTRGDQPDRGRVEQQGNCRTASHRGSHGQEPRAQRHGKAGTAHSPANRRLLPQRTQRVASPWTRRRTLERHAALRRLSLKN